eukprot:15484137-Alexandrium_andersonii.AAC.1
MSSVHEPTSPRGPGTAQSMNRGPASVDHGPERRRKRRSGAAEAAHPPEQAPRRVDVRASALA